MNLEKQLLTAADDIDATFAKFSPGPVIEREIAHFDVGTRRIMVSRDERRRPGFDRRDWPRWQVAIHARLDSGAWVPIRGAYFSFRASDLAGFARVIARCVREANEFARRQLETDDAHWRAMAAARAEVNATP